MATTVRILAGIAARFVDAFDTLTADDLAPCLTCDEVDALADMLSALGRAELATEWVTAHARRDDSDDRHYRKEAPS